jgi:hypothetical protein
MATKWIRRSSSERSIAVWCSVGLALLLGGGCSGPQVEFAEVQGKVMLDGKPLVGVQVTFYPETAGKETLPLARGKTDTAGKYSLATLDGQPGAAVGKHRVVVQWPTPERGDNWEKVPPPQFKGPVIPIKYTAATETPLLFEVKSGAPQTIDLILQAN